MDGLSLLFPSHIRLIIGENILPIGESEDFASPLLAAPENGGGEGNHDV